MALLFCDGFDAADANSKWLISNSAGSTTSTRFGQGRAMSFQTWSSYMLKAIPAASQVYVGFAIKLPTNGNGDFFALKGDTNTTTHVVIASEATSLAVKVGSNTVISVPAIKGAWFYLEISASISDTTGTIVLRRNGVQVGTFTGDTKNGGTNTTIDAVGFAGTMIYELFADDLYICDSTGTANNTFLGDIRVQTLLPTAAGSSTQFTPTSGANYTTVSDVPDVTTTYNYASVVGYRDTYGMGDLLAASGTVLGVQENIHAWKSDSGVGNIKTALKSGASVYYSSSNALGTSMAYYGQMREINPATSTTWTTSDVDALEFGAEVA